MHLCVAYSNSSLGKAENISQRPYRIFSCGIYCRKDPHGDHVKLVSMKGAEPSGEGAEPMAASWLTMVGPKQRAATLIFSMYVQASHGVKFMWRTAFIERGTCLRMQRKNPISGCEPGPGLLPRLRRVQ